MYFGSSLRERERERASRERQLERREWQAAEAAPATAKQPKREQQLGKAVADLRMQLQRDSPGASLVGERLVARFFFAHRNNEGGSSQRHMAFLSRKERARQVREGRAPPKRGALSLSFSLDVHLFRKSVRS